MRASAAVLIGMVSACGHPQVEPRATRTRVPDFCCAAEDCCGVRYYDTDGGVHVQSCRTPAELGDRFSKAACGPLPSWLPSDAGNR